MDCILFRHGIAIDREEWGDQEAQRPLTPKGAQRAVKAAAGLCAMGITPTILFSSPFTRALETAKIILEAVRLQKNVQICDELLPDSPPDKILTLLGSLPPDSCVVFVGHEPHLGEAAGVMLFGKPVNGLSLKKAGACSIRFDTIPKAGRGTLNWWLTPSLLRSLRGK